MTYKPPRRRRTDRRNEIWTVGDHQDFEEGLTEELHGIRQELAGLRRDVTALQLRIAYAIGGLAVLVLLANIFGPVIAPGVVK